MNFLSGVARTENGQAQVAIGSQSIDAPSAVAQAESVLVGIRAENIVASATPPGPAALKAETLVVEPLGSHLLVTATIEGQMLKVITRTDFPARAGEPIWLQPESDKLRWLRASDGAALDA